MPGSLFCCCCCCCWTSPDLPLPVPLALCPLVQTATMISRNLLLLVLLLVPTTLLLGELLCVDCAGVWVRRSGWRALQLGPGAAAARALGNK